MEVKCENCKYAVSNSGRPCREIVGRCSEYKEFVSVEEKPMDKKYRVLKELRFNNGFWQVNGIFEECVLQPFDVNALVNQGYIKEVKEDTLESIIER